MPARIPARFARRGVTALVVTVWLAMAGAGMKLLLDEQSRPGAPATAPANWPVASTLPHTSRTPTLLVFLHPLCPCSHATLAELERLLARTHGGLSVLVIFAFLRNLRATLIPSLALPVSIVATSKPSGVPKPEAGVLRCHRCTKTTHFVAHGGWEPRWSTRDRGSTRPRLDRQITTENDGR